MTYRQVAKTVSQRKAEHPELYCKARGCLWQTAELNPERNGYILNADPCRKHPELNNEPSRREQR